MSELITALDRSTACERIAQLLYGAVEPATLTWADAPPQTREEYRARSREAVRSCLTFAVDAAREAVAQALASADRYVWEDIGPTMKARYRDRAQQAAARYRFHLAETAYPEHVERAIGKTHVSSRTLGELADETRARSLVMVRR